MAGVAAVGIHDDLAPGQAGVALGPALTTKRPVGLTKLESCVQQVRRG